MAIGDRKYWKHTSPIPNKLRAGQASDEDILKRYLSCDFTLMFSYNTVYNIKNKMWSETISVFQLKALKFSHARISCAYRRNMSHLGTFNSRAAGQVTL